MEVGTFPKWCDTPPWYLILHRHICAIPHFATYRVIHARYPIKTNTKEFCDTIATHIAQYEKYRCWASKYLSLSLSLSVFFSVFFLSFSSLSLSLSLSLSILFPWPLSLKGGEVGASSSSRGRRSNVSTLHPKRRRFLEPQHFRNEKQPKEYVLGPDIPRTSTRISRRTSRGKNFGQALQSASAKVSHKRVFTLIR